MCRAAFILVLLVTTCAARGAFSGMVLFGDSLSDVGNVYNQTFGLAPQSPPYFNGRYSNGPLWAEELALHLNLQGPTPSRLGGRDYAYAGTKTGSGSTFIFPFSFPNIGTQITGYLGGNTPSPDQLFVIWGGGNDFIDGQTNPSVPVNNIANHVTALANSGAKQFLVPNLPPLGKVPRFRGTANEATMDARSLQFNMQLASTLSSLELSLNVQIWNLDVGGLFADLLSDPGAYGFTNVTQPALVGGTPVPNPDEYLFWDDIHPTRVGHRILGDIAAELLVTHKWSSTAPSGNWSSAPNWDPPAVPDNAWIAQVVNSSIAAVQTVIVDQNSTVRRVSVAGQTGDMRLVIPAGVTLGAELVEIGLGGSVGGAGTVAAEVINSGRISPQNVLRITGNYTQDPTGTMDIELAGLNPGQFGQLQVTGNAALDGELSVRLGGGFIALPGQSFQVMTFDSRTGDLAIVNSTGFAGLSFNKTFSSIDLTIIASGLGGDANLDALVNLNDFNVLAGNFGGSGATWLEGDFTGDGLVNLSDFNILAANFGQTVAGTELTPQDWAGLASVVPEPSFAALVFVIVLMPSRRWAKNRASKVILATSRNFVDFGKRTG